MILGGGVSEAGLASQFSSLSESGSMKDSSFWKFFNCWCIRVVNFALKLVKLIISIIMSSIASLISLITFELDFGGR